MRAKGKISGPVIVRTPEKGGKAAPVKRCGVLATKMADGLDGVPAGVEVRWVLVAPKLAAEWLANNFVNRPLSDDTVEAYARDGKNGVWALTHQGMAFNDKDELIDGQHRLHGIIKSGVPELTMVTFGLPSKIEGAEMTTMDAVDRGKPRSVADQLKTSRTTCPLRVSILCKGACFCAAQAHIGQPRSTAPSFSVFPGFFGLFRPSQVI